MKSDIPAASVEPWFSTVDYIVIGVVICAVVFWLIKRRRPNVPQYEFTPLTSNTQSGSKIDSGGFVSKMKAAVKICHEYIWSYNENFDFLGQECGCVLWFPNRNC